MVPRARAEIRRSQNGERGRQSDVKHMLVLAGGAEGDRTPDLIIANDALSQLSYSPVPADGLVSVAAVSCQGERPGRPQALVGRASPTRQARGPCPHAKPAGLARTPSNGYMSATIWRPA
ncbi:hypothetical protein MPL3365_150071 [Mesorhizobium plurifarium]|uniref:Uncharacterized protein n=1 Tax=Mesorhizobium plurifarium TaxID=69974 RepID=A0A090G4R2_MESPL|nr:hypothetical protein MPL3365_150071 [Mesorhizobium plurifarium]